LEQVLKLVVAGSINTPIGTRLGISGKTVNTHLKNMYRKRNAPTPAQAVSLTAKHQLF
jgi:DNA-binding CsgD family transcriptional regulator